MSFLFPSWPTSFSPEFHESAKATLEAALNKGNKPPLIQGRIEVVELHMGKEPPALTLLEIGDLSLDRFRGILRLGYQGDAWLEVRCRVQANPLSHNANLNSTILPLSTPLLASQPLLVPMTLRLSKLHLRAILILVVSASKGITLVFKNDPLQNVEVSSTFDSVEVIRGYLQQEIEGQLREMFREDLPGIIHRLSQRWLAGSGVGGKVEMPYRDESVHQRQADWEESPMPPHTPHNVPAVPQNTPMSISPRKRSLPSSRRASNAFSDSPTSYTTFPDIEEYDPTYGLRPEGVPTHSGYEAFGRLWEKNREGGGRGLGSIMGLGKVDEAHDEVDGWDEQDLESLDMVELSDALRPGSLSPSNSGGFAEEDAVEWETYPAVGGGMITRPRIFHAQSQIRIPSEMGAAVPSPSGTATGGSVTARASSVGGASSTIGSLRMTQTPLAGPSHHRTNLDRPPSLRRIATSRSDVFLSQARPASVAAIPNSASSGHLPGRMRDSSRRPSPVAPSSSNWQSSSSQNRATIPITVAQGSPPGQSSRNAPAPLIHSRSPSNATNLTGSFPPRNFTDGSGITLPLNNSVSQLASLSHSAHTLSPYARAHEHIAVRSFPHLGKSSSLSNVNLESSDNAAAKARRKRIYNLGNSNGSSPSVSEIDGSRTAPVTPSLQFHRLPRSQSTSPRASSAELPVPRTPFGWKSASLTGMANRVMTERPGLSRGESRASYGFPPSAYKERS